MARKVDSPSRRRRSASNAKLVGQSVQRVTQPLFRKHGFARDDVIVHWKEIVGRDLARFSFPKKIMRSGSDQGAVLEVRVAGAAAPEFEHMAPQVIERINTYYGYHAIGRLKIEQGPLPLNTGIQREKVLPPLTDSEQKELRSSLSDIEDEDLRGQLQRLGELVKRSQKR